MGQISLNCQKSALFDKKLSFFSWMIFKSFCVWFTNFTYFHSYVMYFSHQPDHRGFFSPIEHSTSCPNLYKENVKNRIINTLFYFTYVCLFCQFSSAGCFVDCISLLIRVTIFLNIALFTHFVQYRKSSTWSEIWIWIWIHLLLWMECFEIFSCESKCPSVHLSFTETPQPLRIMPFVKWMKMLSLIKYINWRLLILKYISVILYHHHQ